MPLFPRSPHEGPLRRPRFDQPAQLPPLQRRRDGRRQVDEGAPALRRRPTGTPCAAWAATRSAPAVPAGRGRTAPTRSRWRSSASRSPSSSWRSSASRSIASTTATSPRKARTSRETNANLDKVVKALEGGAAAHRRQAAVGHRQPVQQPALRPRRGHQLQRRRLRLRRRPGQEGLEVTKELGGVNYVFWGGREGYSNLYNTDLKRELDHLARFFHLAVDYKKKIGFTGQFLIEPKPKEPTTTSTISTPPRSSPSCAATAWPTTSS